MPAYRVVVGPVDFKEKVKRWTTDRTPKSQPFGDADSMGPTRSQLVSRKKRFFIIVYLCGRGPVWRASLLRGKNRKTAKLMLFTIGGLGIWFIVDLLIVIFGEFSDGEGRVISEWF